MDEILTSFGRVIIDKKLYASVDYNGKKYTATCLGTQNIDEDNAETMLTEMLRLQIHECNSYDKHKFRVILTSVSDRLTLANVLYEFRKHYHIGEKQELANAIIDINNPQVLLYTNCKALALTLFKMIQECHCSAIVIDSNGNEIEPTYKITLLDLGLWKLKTIKALTEWRKTWRPDMTSDGSILNKAKEDIENAANGGIIQDGMTKKSADKLFNALKAAGAQVFISEENNKD